MTEQTITAADLWQNAMTPEAYVARMTQRREQFERVIDTTEITDTERAAFGGEPLRVLALTEDFCGDSAQFIPPVIRLGRELGTLEVRLLLRDEYRDFASRYLRRDGYQAIPVLILIDADGQEIGHLIERPERVTDELASETRRFVNENPQLEGGNRAYDRMPPETKARVRANSDHFRVAHQARWTRWLFEDLACILAEGVTHRASRAAAR